MGDQTISPELKGWLDIVIIPALVRAWLDESVDEGRRPFTEDLVSASAGSADPYRQPPHDPEAGMSEQEKQGGIAYPRESSGFATTLQG